MRLIHWEIEDYKRNWEISYCFFVLWRPLAMLEHDLAFYKRGLPHWEDQQVSDTDEDSDMENDKEAKPEEEEDDLIKSVKSCKRDESTQLAPQPLKPQNLSLIWAFTPRLTSLPLGTSLGNSRFSTIPTKPTQSRRNWNYPRRLWEGSSLTIPR